MSEPWERFYTTCFIEHLGSKHPGKLGRYFPDSGKICLQVSMGMLHCIEVNCWYPGLTQLHVFTSKLMMVQ